MAMKQLLLLLVLVAAVGAAYFIGRSTAPHGAAAPAEGATQLYTCSMHPQVLQDSPGLCPICHMELTPVRDGASAGDGAVTIDPSVLQNMGVRTAKVTRGPLVQRVRVVGNLEEPEPLHRDINLRVNGWIEKLYADTDGMVITQGKPLFDLYSPELTVAIDELIAARKQVGQQSMLDTSRRKLLQLGLAESQVDALSQLDAAPRSVPILAPISGHLTAKMVYEGAAVKAGDLVLRLASRHRMWIDAQVYEQQMPLISDGQPVRATLVAQPGRTFEGRVLFVHPHIDPMTRTALVRIEIPNDDLHLRQGMYATVEIQADNYEEVLIVPREAVIDSGARQVVFLDLGGGKFAPRDVKLGLAAQDGAVQVLDGLKEGETIVTSGQFLIDSESRMREAIAKFGAAPPTSALQVTTTQPASRPARVSVPHTQEIVRAYLALSESLGARQTSDAALDVTPLLKAVSMAVEHGNGDAKLIAEAVARAARSMEGQSLDAQRRSFLDVSDAVIALVRASPPDAGTLYVFNCPMAFDTGDGAHWLQSDDDIANPYYATAMKKCGELVERVPPQAK
jgi:membrane fusion protein, copper/silver efflux system